MPITKASSFTPKSMSDTVDTVDTADTEEMAYDYASFLLSLWHSGQRVNKINEKG